MPFDNEDKAGRMLGASSFSPAAQVTADEQIADLMRANAALKAALAEANREQAELTETVRLLSARESALRSQLAESRRAEEFLWDALHSLGGASQVPRDGGDLVRGVRSLAETILGPRSAWYPRKLS